MDKIIRKLTSRKMWLAIAEFVSMMMLALGKTESEAAKVVALIMAGAGVIAYIIGEGLADSAGASAPTVQVTVPTDKDADDLK